MVGDGARKAFKKKFPPARSCFPRTASVLFAKPISQTKGVCPRRHCGQTSKKPERLIRRILQIATNPGDLVLDSFAGSGTTGAVAHKMGRCWIMVELGKHCHSHIIPRMKRVIEGRDPSG